jgi:Fe2+ transport system protein FeoA
VLTLYNNKKAKFIRLRGTKMTLDMLKNGETAVIKTVGGEGALRLRFLDMGLIPHTAVTLQKTAPMGDPIEIRVRGYELTLRKADARLIEVEKI